MQIIAGEWRGRKLNSPEGEDTRPTLGRTKESLFSMLFGHLEGKRVLDLFAGSGALALESLSRGAEHAVLADAAPKAIRAIEENIAALHAQDRTLVFKGEWQGVLQRLHAQREKFDLIFIDPPYRLDAAPVLYMLMDCQMLREHGIIVLEHAAVYEAPIISACSIWKQRRFRDTMLTFYIREEA